MDADRPISDVSDARLQRDARSSEAAVLLRRAEANLAELRSAAQLLTAVLPTRVEAAVARALDDREAGRRGRADDVHRQVRETAAAVGRIEQDLLVEQVGRTEDLGLVVD